MQQGGKCRTEKWWTENAGVENAGLENAGPLTLALKKTKKFAMHRLVTFMLLDVAVVPNVPLKSAKTHTVPPQIQLKTLNTLQSQQSTRQTMSIGGRHKGHPFPISVTYLHMQNINGRGRTALMLRRHVEPVGRLRTFRSLTYPDEEDAVLQSS